MFQTHLKDGRKDDLKNICVR